MAYLDNDTIVAARQMDLLTYLREYEPQELVRINQNTYCTKTHDSLKISNGKWMWWSRGIGGGNALDYLTKVKGKSFLDAVNILTQHQPNYSHPIPMKTAPKPKLLLLPPKNKSCDIVTEYLFSRGIDIEIIQDCINKGYIFESLPYHNAVFVGTDQFGKPRYAAYRGVGDKRIMGDASGSDKTFSFRLTGKEDSSSVHIFESAIDALSYATLLKMDCKNWKDYHLISLAGVYAPKDKIEDSKLPAALQTFLDSHPNVRQVYLHLDNDVAGRTATSTIITKLSPVYEVIDRPPTTGKDVNDYLCSKLGIRKKNERSFER